VLALFVVWSIVGEAVRTGGLGDAALDDYAIARSRSLEILERDDYGWQLRGAPPAVLFAYPPPYAIGHAVLAAAGPRVGPGVFMAWLAAAAWLGARAGLSLLGAARRPLRWLGVLLAVASCRVFLQADLHLLNVNVPTVALALAALAAFGPRERRGWHAAAGGLLLACSLAIKPWAGAIGLALAALGRGSAIAWSLSGGLLVFAVVPVLAVGPSDALVLTLRWLAILPVTLDPSAIGRIAVDNVSIPAAGVALGLEGVALAAFSRGLQLLWLAGIGAVVVPALRAARGGRALDGRGWLRIGATLLIAPVPLGAVFQPHHGVAAWPLALLVATDALDPTASRPARAGRLVLLAAVFCVSSYAASGPARGIAYLACFAALVAAAWWPLVQRPGRDPESASRDRTDARASSIALE